MLKFEWDETKAASNLSKHGASFAEAATVFATRWLIPLTIQTTLSANSGC